jgi:uncharacterized protein (TIGR03435 family)
MPFRRVLWLIAALTGVAAAQHTGDIPPALVWNTLKGTCPASLDWERLRGTVVVISLSPDPVFPDDIVEWNEIARKFQGEPVLLIRVVAGSEFLLDQALKQTAFQGCILFDSDLANIRNFKLPRLARTVVVDQLGSIAGYSRGGPDEQGVQSVLSHKLHTGLLEVPPLPQRFDPAAGPDAMPTYEVQISPAPPGELRLLGVGGSDRYISKNQPLKVIILDLWNTTLARVAFPEKLDQGNYNVTAHVPGVDREVLQQLTREAVERQFNLRVEKQERMERAYVLTVLRNLSPQLQTAVNGEKWMSGVGQESIIGTAQAMPDIARTFEDLLNVPVIDETGWQGKYNYSVSIKLTGSEAAFDMAHQLGLELTEVKRPIEMLVVRNILVRNIQ